MVKKKPHQMNTRAGRYTILLYSMTDQWGWMLGSMPKLPKIIKSVSECQSIMVTLFGFRTKSKGLPSGQHWCDAQVWFCVRIPPELKPWWHRWRKTSFPVACWRENNNQKVVMFRTSESTTWSVSSYLVKWKRWWVRKLRVNSRPENKNK